MTSAPRIFTKMMKPTLSHLRKLGLTVFCYLDYRISIVALSDELRNNVRYAMQFFYSLGRTIYEQKSVLKLTQEVEFIVIFFIFFILSL